MQIYFAPMEGITTFVYRNAFHRYYGGIDKFFTPFLSSQKLNYKEINDILPAHNEGIPLVPQILTNQAETFLAIAKQLAAYGYQEVNLNLGCPSATVTSKKRGAGFLSVPEQLDAFLDTIFTACPLAISLKTRIGISSLQEWDKVLSIYAKYPLSELIIHPRLQQEFYNGAPHPEAFRLACNTLSVPLCYNGDITSAASLDALVKEVPSTQTIMLGRGALANPQLPSRLRGNAVPEAPDRKRFAAFHNEILEGYIALMSGERPVLYRMKELWVYMGSYLHLTEKQLKQIHKTNRLSEYQGLIQAILTQI